MGKECADKTVQDQPAPSGAVCSGTILLSSTNYLFITKID